MSCTLLQYCKKFTVMQIKLVVVVAVVAFIAIITYRGRRSGNDERE